MYRKFCSCKLNLQNQIQTLLADFKLLNISLSTIQLLHVNLYEIDTNFLLSRLKLAHDCVQILHFYFSKFCFERYRIHVNHTLFFGLTVKNLDQSHEN